MAIGPRNDDAEIVQLVRLEWRDWRLVCSTETASTDVLVLSCLFLLALVKYGQVIAKARCQKK